MEPPVFYVMSFYYEGIHYTTTWGPPEDGLPCLTDSQFLFPTYTAFEEASK
jgi:hypothetical protein